MERYRRLGLARQIRKLGLPPDQPTDVTYSTRTNGWELARIKMPSESEKMRRVREASTTDQVPEPILRCKPDVCRAFRPGRTQGVVVGGRRWRVACS
jgi:hypothetical protein